MSEIVELEWKTPPELLAEEPSTQWLLKGWFAKGVVTEVVGDAKMAGKSTLILRMVRSVLTGEQWLGDIPQVTGPVLYLTEEVTSEFVPGLKRAGLGALTELHVLQWCRLPNLTWEQLLEHCKVKAAEVGAVWLIVDTLGQFTLGGDVDENSAADGIRLMQPVQKLAMETGLSVLLVRHTRKAGGRIGKGGRGSGAYSGAVGGLLQIECKHEKSTKRYITSNGRLDGVARKVVIQWDGNDYEVCEEEDEHERPAKLLLEDLLKHLPATLDEAARKSGYAKSTVWRRLQEAKRKGQIAEEGTGSKVDPYIYVRAATEKS